MDKKLLKLKYLVLVGIIVAAIMGTHLGGWLDPFSLLTRSATIAVNPSVNYAVSHSLKTGAQDTGVVAKGLKPASVVAAATHSKDLTPEVVAI